MCKTKYLLFIPLLLVFLIFIQRRFGKRALTVTCIFVAALGIGLSHINISTYRTEIRSVVIDSKENYYIVSSFGEKFYIKEKGNEKEIGDVIVLKGEQEKLEFATLESEFNFQDYLNNKNVYKSFKVYEENSVFKNPLRTKKVRTKFLAHFDSDTQDFYSSILFSNSLKGDLTNEMRFNHISRLISFGGIYIYSFLKIIEYILGKFLKEKTANVVSTAILTFYSLFTLPKFAPIKILFIRVLRLMNKYKFNNKFSSISIIAFSGLIFLSLNPCLAKQQAFILGYLIPLNNRFVDALYIKSRKIKKKFFELIWLYFFFIPFEISFNYSTNFISFISQIFLSPIFILSGFLGFLCFFKLPIYAVSNLFTKVIVLLSKGISFLSFSINVPAFPSYFLPIYYFLYYLFMYYSQVKFVPIVRTLKIVYIVGLSLYCIPIKTKITEEVSFINVGQGDCCLVRSGTLTALIDTGGLTYKDIATSSIIPFLKKKRLYDIDLVILTHEDYDHSGSLESLKKHFMVKKVITNADTFPISFGDISFKNYNVFYSSNEDENFNSLVIGFSLSKIDYLITGDAPIEIEDKIMENNQSIPCDVLKVGHHGSNTSTSDKFVKFLNPKEAIISVGANNKYKHPHDSVIKILKNNNVEVKRTDILGTITYSNYKFL